MTGFDLTDHLHGLRRRETCWLQARRAELVREQRRLRVEELAVTRVLDERGALDEAVAAADGVSDRTVRDTIETARALEALPKIAGVAHAGRLSHEQLGAVTAIADEVSDTEWAARAPDIAPADLARIARCQRTPTVADSRARREARFLRWWWAKDTGMLNVRGALPDIDGARVAAVLEHMTDRMAPERGAKGSKVWDSLDHRGADALLELATNYEHVEVPASAPRPLLVVPVPPDGPATIAGIPLPDELVEQLRATAVVEPVLVDEHGAPRAVGRRTRALSPKIARAVLIRDGHCRVPGCERRRGLEVHHLVPRSWGGADRLANLASVCARHHAVLVPHGPWALVGNPNRPEGIRLVRYEGLTPEEARELGLPPPASRRE